MTENQRQFKNSCIAYFLTRSLAELRSYGREVGVSRPTAQNKEELIEAILAVLLGEVEPIPVSRQGAPVKNIWVNEQIPAKIKELQEEFLFKKEEIPSYDFEREYKKVLEQGPLVFQVASPEAEKRGYLSQTATHGQLYLENGQYLVYAFGGQYYGKKLYVPQALVNEKRLREGDVVTCYTREAPTGFLSVGYVSLINGLRTENLPNRPEFDGCEVEIPNERIRCATNGNSAISMKFVEWLLPLYKGQRACVISEPKAGKTRFMSELLSAVKALNEDIKPFALLVEQAPESVAEYRRILKDEHAVYATTYEDEPEAQVFMANMALNHAKRLAEDGKNVFLIVDSLNALARAFNDTEESAGGKTLEHGLESKTLRYLKKFFATARRLRGKGSVTIVGAVNVNTGNPLDDFLCSEFSAQANYEIRLNAELAVRRLYPAVDLLTANAKQGEGVHDGSRLDCFLRNAVLPKIGAAGLLTELGKAESYEAFLENVERIAKN